MLDIAYHGAGDTVQSSDLTARLGIAPRYLEPVLQEMVRGGLLESVRGPGGGYRLARPRDQIFIRDIIQIARTLEQGGDALNNDQGSPLGMAVIWPWFQTVLENLNQNIALVSLEDFCQSARHSGIASAAVERMDYVI